MFTVVVMPMHLARISTFPFISFTIHLFHHWMCSNPAWSTISSI